ncbi:hypothetical protein C8R44DRAFT_846814 [Mycena epipterygia]|nr:hypothetical protein C8R44DRAFT_846814 [Mycena epipterygia]
MTFVARHHPIFVSDGRAELRGIGSTHRVPPRGSQSSENTDCNTEALFAIWILVEAKPLVLFSAQISLLDVIGHAWIPFLATISLSSAANCLSTRIFVRFEVNSVLCQFSLLKCEDYRSLVRDDLDLRLVGVLNPQAIDLHYLILASTSTRIAYIRLDIQSEVNSIPVPTRKTTTADPRLMLDTTRAFRISISAEHSIVNLNQIPTLIISFRVQRISKPSASEYPHQCTSHEKQAWHGQSANDTLCRVDRNVKTQPGLAHVTNRSKSVSIRHAYCAIARWTCGGGFGRRGGCSAVRTWAPCMYARTGFRGAMPVQDAGDSWRIAPGAANAPLTANARTELRVRHMEAARHGTVARGRAGAAAAPVEARRGGDTEDVRGEECAANAAVLDSHGDVGADPEVLCTTGSVDRGGVKRARKVTIQKKKWRSVGQIRTALGLGPWKPLGTPGRKMDVPGKMLASGIEALWRWRSGTNAWSLGRFGGLISGVTRLLMPRTNLVMRCVTL